MSEKDGNIDAHSVPIKSIHSNVAQVVIHTTEDKLKNILNEYTYTQHDSKSWIAPLGIFLTLVGTLTTSTPNDFLLPPYSPNHNSGRSTKARICPKKRAARPLSIAWSSKVRFRAISARGTTCP